jgi:hypothetical protein
VKYARPQEARTPPPGPCLGALRLSQGLRLEAYDSARRVIALSAATDHRERDHVLGIAMQIPTTLAVRSLRERIRSICVETFTRRMTWTRSELPACWGSR